MTRGRPAVRMPLACAAVAALAGAAQGAPAGLGKSLPFLLPFVLLLLALARRRYPGESVLLAFRGRKRPRLRPAPCTGEGHRPPLRALVPRGGSLIASSLAVRPPPALAAVSLSH